MYPRYKITCVVCKFGMSVLNVMNKSTEARLEY